MRFLKRGNNMIKDLTGYEGNLPDNKYWKKEFRGMPFTVSYDNRKGEDCIGSGSIGILFADGEEIAVSNTREELVKYELSHTL